MTKMLSQPVVCVVKMDRTSVISGRNGREAVLFYRDDYGDITCFTRSEGHSGCCPEYYRRCTPPKTLKEIHEADQLFALYETIPGGDAGIVRRKRLPSVEDYRKAGILKSKW